jgi:hypothetical protein
MGDKRVAHDIDIDAHSQDHSETPDGVASGRRSWTIALIVVVGFNMLSAVGGGIALASTNGLGMPLSLLERSPFDSFTGPGVILAAVVGGTQAIALVLLLVQHRFALAAAAVAAFGMIVWIYVEVSMLLFYHWLQTVYFLTGTIELAIVLILLGVLGASRATRAHVDVEFNSARERA